MFVHDIDLFKVNTYGTQICFVTTFCKWQQMLYCHTQVNDCYVCCLSYERYLHVYYMCLYAHVQYLV